ncbi:L,D-transpeptidase family protein [Thioclava sp. GXIMD4216]|uniref:L,D-transpeptidase family protein n=1 Tax=Thioclava sp. GXIMD4216 TaxID=3131929 RepID=UPI0030CFF542
MTNPPPVPGPVPRLIPKLVLAIGCAIALPAYTKIMARIGSGTPPAMAATAQQADLVVVSKPDRQMVLMRQGQILKRYPVTFGAHWQDGPKQVEGDERTPEGSYHIDWRNSQSMAHLSLHISYPDATDRARAAAAGHDPGGNIMIHGLPNGWGALGRLHRLWNWTDGCVAVTNAQMEEIWSLVPNGTRVVLSDAATDRIVAAHRPQP